MEIDKEIRICIKYSSSAGKCKWGKCETCGFPHWLYKQQTGIKHTGKSTLELIEELKKN